MAQDGNILSNAVGRVPASDITTELIPVDINSSNKWAASTAGGYSDATLQDTGESPSELTGIFGNSGARFGRVAGTCTAGSEAAVTTDGYKNAANGDVAVGRFLETKSTTGDSVLFLPYERAQYQKGESKVAFVTVTGAAGSSGVFASWANPEAGTIVITRATLHIATQSTGASTLDIGTTATSATTSSDTLIDGVSGATAGVFDNLNDAGTNGKSRQTLATGKWVNVAEASGDVNGLAATLRIEYYTV